MKRGFTLIEMIIALMIFSIVAVVALAALVKIVDANKKAQTTQDAVLGLSFALESMSRELRTATTIRCETTSTGSFTDPGAYAAQSCPSVGHNQLLLFKSANTDYTSTPPCRLIYAYLFSGSGPYQLSKAQQRRGNGCTDTFNSTSFYPITPLGVSITDYEVGVSPDQFSYVFLGLSGYAGVREQVKTYFTVQTAVSQRSQ
jgi:prepilin-type N-terminal cleavage/methylation domain-containing protein